jgi:hypothetical protein
MNTQEMQQKYEMLYNTMAASGKPENMKLFGHVMTEMMNSAIQKNPSEAQQWIEKLGAIEWKNYLTPREADNIVAEMVPSAPWTREVWNKAMDSYGYSKEDKPYYNSCALFVEMNSLMSTHGDTLTSILSASGQQVPEETLLDAVYRLAVDKLKNESSMVNIRHAYGL